jgi:hypothetical protein
MDFSGSVRNVSFRHHITANSSSQDRELYVFDPAALHNILVQEPDVYEQPPKFLAYVSCLYFNVTLTLLV